MNEKKTPEGLQGNGIAIFGGENQGKTTWLQENLIHLNSGMVWDPKHQYGDLCATYDPGRVPTKEKLDEYIDYVCRLDQCVPVIEEASIFFANTGKSSDKMLAYLQGRYHSLIIPVTVFQNISEMPHSVYKRMDWFVLFPTGETEDQVKDKYDKTRLFDAFMSKQAERFNPLVFRKSKAA